MIDFNGATVTTLLAPVSAANTGAATSAWTALGDIEGEFAIVVAGGVVQAGASVTMTFNTATLVDGTGTTAMTPVGGALTVLGPGNDPLVQIAVFPATANLGFINAVGTVVGAGALLSYTIVSRPKYGS